MTLTPEQRAAIEERYRKALKATDGRITESIRDLVYSDIPALLQALREAEAERDRALDQVVAAVEELKDIATFGCCGEEDPFCSEAGITEEEWCHPCKANAAVMQLQPTAQAHAARLRQEGREEERVRISAWAELNAYKPRNPDLGEFQTVVSFYALREQLQQPTDAAEGGSDA